MKEHPQMLEGYRVLDFTHFVAGPTCSRILAEMGADVIKIERNLGGDRVRKLGLVRGGISTYYFQHNHSKRSLGLDLTNPAARELILRMIPRVDVVVENFAPGVIAKMGFGYEVLSGINPRLVMCSISVAGQTGPLSNKPGYDYIGAALAGVIDQLGESDRAPIVPSMAIGDVSTGVCAAMAIGFALLHRERTGEGQWIDASILDDYFQMHELAVPVVSLRPDRFQPKRTGSHHPTAVPCGVFQAPGGYVLMMVQQHEIDRLWRAMKRPDLAEDSRFATNRDRLKNSQALIEIIEQWFETFPDRDSVIRVLEAERVPCAPVLRLEESMVNPHLRQRGTVRRVHHDVMGDFDIPGMPVKFSRWSQRTDVRASLVGEDNQWVLREVAGMSVAEIEEIERTGALISAT